LYEGVGTNRKEEGNGRGGEVRKRRGRRRGKRRGGREGEERRMN